MKTFLETNVYSFQGTVLLYGACLPEVSPAGFAKLAEQADGCYALCLERDHLNMAITKLTAVLGTGRVKQLLLATVDRSPHCVQMHYIPHEIERILPEHIPMESWVVIGDRPIRISPETVERSKSLAKLETESSR
ncbi:MAG: hypothetical protein J5789_07680 [Oscillospiraceae bacterium]|nr:hypothetical protein [Oscillospiraceae bacterium]